MSEAVRVLFTGGAYIVHECVSFKPKKLFYKLARPGGPATAYCHKCLTVFVHRYTVGDKK